MAKATFRDTVFKLISAEDKEGHDFTLRQLGVLLHCAEADGAKKPAPVTVRGMAEALNLVKPAITRALDRLQGAGLVKRAADPDDRRSVLIQMTDKGRAYAKELL